MKNNLSIFELSATFKGKPAKFIVTVDHDVLHNTNGKIFDHAFYMDLGNKLHRLLPLKDELTHLRDKILLPEISFPIICGWSEQEINYFLFNDVFNQTHNMGYIEIGDKPLNPAGVTINFEFIE